MHYTKIAIKIADVHNKNLDYSRMIIKILYRGIQKNLWEGTMRYLCIAILLTISVLLIANNQLDIVWQQHGEQANDSFGKNVVALDFNGDNIDDLAVTAYRFLYDENNESIRGKLYIYYGSDEGLSESPDVTYTADIDTTTYNRIYQVMHLNGIGDLNGDGCDDLSFISAYREIDNTYHYYHNILMGNTIGDSLIDYIWESPSSFSNIDLHPLGDINGDGYDDAGVTEEKSNHLTYSIIYGGSFEKVVFVDSIYTHNGRGFRGLGDVNNDGYDDFSYYYEGDYVDNTDGTNTYYHYDRFFWGGTIQDTIPDASLDYERRTYGTSNWYELTPAGDWDGDGYDDFAFTYYDIDEEFTALGTRLWRGGETIDWDRYTYIETYNFFRPAVGDINGDQKIDYVDTYPTEYGGCLYFYLGNQNGTKDYDEFDGHYGYGPSAVGDFNNDGFDDIAVGAWGQNWDNPNNYGDVYVYGGHAGLVEQDPTPIDDETVPPADITFNAYPNPFNPEVSFEIATDQNYKDLHIEIFNAKGQKIETIPIRTTQETITWNAGDFASGVYFCKLNAGDRTLRTQKVTLLK